MESAPALKFCPCCFNTTDNFTPDKRNKDGLNYRCRVCATAYIRMSRHANPLPFYAAVKKYRESLRDYQA